MPHPAPVPVSIPQQHYVGVRAFRMELPTFLDRIEKRGSQYVVVRHGKPVARIVPFAEIAPVYPLPQPHAAMRPPIRSRPLSSRPKPRKGERQKRGFSIGGLFLG